MKLILALLLTFILADSAQAQGATITLPSVVVTSPPSTAISCAAVAASYPAPMAVGTIAFNCSVSPSTWTGAVSISGSQFGVTALVGNKFNVSVIGAALAAGTYQPGTLTTLP